MDSFLLWQTLILKIRSLRGIIPFSMLMYVRCLLLINRPIKYSSALQYIDVNVASIPLVVHVTIQSRILVDLFFSWKFKMYNKTSISCTLETKTKKKLFDILTSASFWRRNVAVPFFSSHIFEVSTFSSRDVYITISIDFI